MLTGRLDLAGILETAAAVRRASEGADFVLRDSGVIHGMLRVLAPDSICLIDAEANAGKPAMIVLWPAAGEPLTACHTLTMPLPASPGQARTLVFLRWPGYPFGEEDQAAAALLQPHIADALRSQSRRAAARLLTGRQCELLRLVAAGHDNIAIARWLGLSPYTVRKHLENAFARLNVSSRTAAVAKFCPDVAWPEPPAVSVAVAYAHAHTG